MRCSISTCRSDTDNDDSIAHGAAQASAQDSAQHSSQHSARSAFDASAHWLSESPPAAWKLPLAGDAKIHWNTFGVPYAVAGNLHDAAVLVGAACYLLRANQIQLFRHVAWGRLSELGGPMFIRTDAMIRSLDMHCAQDAIIAGMPSQTRDWITAFCAGMNAVAACTPRNREARVLGIHHRPFDIRDILAIGRLTGTDVNWPMLFDLFPLSSEEGFSDIWRRILAAGGFVSDSASAQSADSDFWLLRANRSGSNCVAIHGSLTASGKPLLASDPHLNHQLPNLWLLMGVQCPQMHAVGLMFPGVPVIGLGRNARAAWGGTNLRASSSDLVKLQAADVAGLQSRQTVIRVRGWPDARRTLRYSTHGPVVSDHIGGKNKNSTDVLALRWAGHMPSDEITAFLNLMQLDHAQDIQSAMRTYAVTGLNIVAADVDGHIAQTHAAWLPHRAGFSETHFVVDSVRARQEWASIHTSRSLPFVRNPACGYVVSTNQDPRADFPVSWFFNGEERNRRLQQLLEMRAPIGVDDVRRWQTDVFSRQALMLARHLLEQVGDIHLGADDLEAVEVLRAWDGHYRADSEGALVFEALLAALRNGLIKHEPGVSGWWVVQEWAYICNFLLEDVMKLQPDRRERLLRKALRVASGALVRHGQWGQVHRLAPRHILGGLPWVGRRWFPALDMPAAGSRETLMKNSHGWFMGRQRSSYGAQARQICDLSHPDANWFVLLGGQDERVESPHALDQAGLWERSQYVRMPLSPVGIVQDFGRVWRFAAQARG